MAKGANVFSRRAWSGLTAAWIAVALGCADAGPAAGAGAGTRYAGRTSQGQPIAFSVVAGQLRELRLYVIIACPDRHRYRDEAYGFSGIAIRHRRFSASFPSEKPPASAMVNGRTSGGQVSGTVRLSRYVAGERSYCTGVARFVLRPPRRLRGR